MKAFNVYENGRLIDTVFFNANTDVNYVRQSLIEHDGYSPNILVVSVK